MNYDYVLIVNNTYYLHMSLQQIHLNIHIWMWILLQCISHRSDMG